MQGQNNLLLIKHLEQKYLYYLKVVCAGLLAISMLILYFRESKNIGLGQFDYITLVKILLLSIPNLLSLALPWIINIPLVWSLSSLVRNGELLNFFINRFTALQFFLKYSYVIIKYLCLFIIFIELAKPYANTYITKIKNKAWYGSKYVQNIKDQVWLKLNDSYIFIGKTNSHANLEKIYIIDINNDQANIKFYNSALLLQGNSWQLSEGLEYNFSNELRITKLDRTVVNNFIANKLLEEDDHKIFDRVRIHKLFQYYKQLKAIGADTKLYEIMLLERLTQPISILLTALVLIPLFIIHPRINKLILRILTSIGIMIFANVQGDLVNMFSYDLDLHYLTVKLISFAILAMISFMLLIRVRF